MPSTNPSQRGYQGGAAILSSCHASLAVPSLSHCAAPLSSRLPYFDTPPSLVVPPPLSSRHASLAIQSLSPCTAPLLLRRPSLVVPPISHCTTASLVAPRLTRAGWLLHCRLSCCATHPSPGPSPRHDSAGGRWLR
jgi:hypothetical protein